MQQDKAEAATAAMAIAAAAKGFLALDCGNGCGGGGVVMKTCFKLEIVH